MSDNKPLVVSFFSLLIPFLTEAKSTSLVDTSDSPYSHLSMVEMDDVMWTDGFWRNDFRSCKKT